MEDFLVAIFYNVSATRYKISNCYIQGGSNMTETVTGLFTHK